MRGSELEFPCGGCGTMIRTVDGKSTMCPCQCECQSYESGVVAPDGSKEVLIDPCKPCMEQATSAGDARCNFCDGPMPCHCPNPPGYDSNETYTMAPDGSIRRVR